MNPVTTFGFLAVILAIIAVMGRVEPSIGDRLPGASDPWRTLLVIAFAYLLAWSYRADSHRRAGPPTPAD